MKLVNDYTYLDYDYKTEHRQRNEELVNVWLKKGGQITKLPIGCSAGNVSDEYEEEHGVIKKVSRDGNVFYFKRNRNGGVE